MDFERGHHVRYVRPNEHLLKYAGKVVEARGVDLGSFGVVNGVGQVHLSDDGQLRYYPVVYVNVAKPDGISTSVFWADELELIQPAFTVERAAQASADPVGWAWSFVVREPRRQWVIRDTRSQALVRSGDLVIWPPIRWDRYEDAQATADFWNWCDRHLAPKTENDLHIRMCSQRTNRVCLLCQQEFEE